MLFRNNGHGECPKADILWHYPAEVILLPVNTQHLELLIVMFIGMINDFIDLLRIEGQTNGGFPIHSVLKGKQGCAARVIALVLSRAKRKARH